MRILLRIIIFIIFIIPAADISGQIYIRDIHIIRKNVFDSTRGDWFFAAPVFNALHTKTREYIVRDELLFAEGDEVTEDILYETERNLRATELFTDAYILLDSIAYDEYDAYVVTHDKWSLYPSILVGTGGGDEKFGGGIEEKNFLGLGTYLRFDASHRSENDIGWEGRAMLSQQRLFRSELTLQANIQANQFRTEDTLRLFKPYRTLDTRTAYGIEGSDGHGSDFIFTNDSMYLAPFQERQAKGWFSHAWWRKDRVFITGLVEYHDVRRPDPANRRAFDNSGKILIAFSSIAQDFVTTSMLDDYFPTDIPVGGWGSAIIGKTFPIGSEGDGLYYVAGQGERSYYAKDIYLFGRVVGASGFARSQGRYTYEEFYGVGFYRLNRNLLLTGRVRQQTVWNWDAQRQLIIDTDYGLRGYESNFANGDNRFLANAELRYFPDWEFAVVNFSAVAFWDIGSVWDQEVDLADARFYNSAGLGLRLHFTKDKDPGSTFRLDFAYNFEEKRFGGIIFTTRQLFSAFEKHIFRLPQVFGLEFDYE
ncbi:MAG: hypothetical protein ACLFQX_08340 [Candidatus Kapaibacterium sp.]